MIVGSSYLYSTVATVSPCPSFVLPTCTSLQSVRLTSSTVCTSIASIQSKLIFSFNIRQGQELFIVGWILSVVNHNANRLIPCFLGFPRVISDLFLLQQYCRCQNFSRRYIVRFRRCNSRPSHYTMLVFHLPPPFLSRLVLECRSVAG